MSRRLRVLALAFACSLAAAESAAAGIWTKIESGTTHDVTAIEYQSPTRFWFTTAAGEIYTRRPGGSFAQARAPSGVPLNDVEFQAGGQIGLAVGNGGQVVRSTDAGATWTTVSPVLPPADRSCTGSTGLGDLNAVRFAGQGRAWIFSSGSQIPTSQPTNASQVGAAGSWRDANRADDGTCRVASGQRYADAFFVPSNPDVGYIVAERSPWASVYFTSNNLATPSALKSLELGTFAPSRVIAGDPENPSRMWSVDTGGWATPAYTRDGWQTRALWRIGNASARTWEPLADVDYTDRTVLAAGVAGMILNSVDGETFSYSSADAPLQTQRWNAVGLASATLGALGGDNGMLAVTEQANFVPPAPTPTPTPTPRPTPTAAPPPAPVAGRSFTSGTVSGRVRVRIGGRYVPLGSGQRVPLEANVDARSGTLAINVAVNAVTGATQSATLSKGIFRVAQRRRGATASTSIRLLTPPGSKRACAARKGPRKGIVRTLSGAVNGSFAVVGAAATATVRNGSWLLEDTCKGTRVKNVRGTLTVTAKRARRAITVRPGRTYLVKARLFAARRRARGSLNGSGDRDADGRYAFKLWSGEPNGAQR